MKVFVTGATGFLGTQLCSALLARGERVVALTRTLATGQAKLPRSVQLIEGDPAKAGAWMDAIAGCDAVVNLAGEKVLARWTPELKTRILASRVQSTRNVVEAINRAPTPPALVSASAVGIYGLREDEELDETSTHGSDFLATVCAEWEAEALKLEKARVAIVRIGVVLGDGGGALEKMLTPYKLFVGGPLGSGRQWLSWIHIADLVGILLLAIDSPQVRGPVNATAPHPATMKEFGRALGRALGRPSWAPVPGFAVKAIFGQAAEILLEGQRVLPRRALSLGYQFKYETLEVALGELVGKKKAS